MKLNVFNKSLQFKDLPEWCNTLSLKPRFTELGFSILTEEDYKKTNKKEKSIFCFGKSIDYSNFNSLCLAVDMQKPELLRISFNQTESEVFFFIQPTMDELEKVYTIYMKDALTIPNPGSALENVARLLDAQPLVLNYPDKKEIIFCVGHGDWYDDMPLLENSMCFNRYVSLYCLCQATAYSHADDAAVSQYYTAFSASLCSLIRYEAFKTTFFYLSFEYVPSEQEYTKQFKANFPNESFIQQFPDDAPLDILGLFMDAKFGALFTHDDLFNNVTNGGFNELLYLVAMTDLTPKFEHYFIQLASHKDEQIRDFIAEEAHTKKNKRVLNEVLKHGVSSETLALVSVPWEE